jgi:hypothetical protein
MQGKASSSSGKLIENSKGMYASEEVGRQAEKARISGFRALQPSEAHHEAQGILC